jgi:hypothetical protein
MTRFDQWKLDTPPNCEAAVPLTCETCAAEMFEGTVIDGRTLCNTCRGPACELCGKYGCEANEVSQYPEPGCSDGTIPLCDICHEAQAVSF